MLNRSASATAMTMLLAAGLPGCNGEATGPLEVKAAPAAAVAASGNGAPSGAHYTLNIIGMSRDKSADFSGGDGHRIFVDLGRSGDAVRTRINLTEGDFAVLDANGTDGAAAFQLPNPDPDGDGTTTYSVYVRALGKPGGKATMQSCYEDDTGTWCAVDFAGGVEPITIERTKGGASKFQNVSKDLLYVDVCTEWSAGLDGVLGTSDDECTDVDQQPLFSDDLSYFWAYDNEGLKLAQLRFYEVPTATGF